MDELLNEVLIKEITDAGIDKVFYVQNLPKRLIYMKIPKMVTRYDRDGYTDGTQVVDPMGGFVDGLLDGLEHSQCGDQAIHFIMGRETARNALKAVDAYIAGTLPRDVVLPKRVPYPIDPTDSRSAPKFRSEIPSVELPVFKAALVQVSPETQVSPAKPARSLTAEQKKAASERLARAREIKKQQAANKANAPA